MIKFVRKIKTKKRLEQEKRELRALELLVYGVIVEPGCLTDKVYAAIQGA